MPENRVVLIGAGLAGSLLAIYLARRGMRVTVFEARPDMRRFVLPDTLAVYELLR